MHKGQKQKPGYVYVIIDESQRIKLGYSNDADIRLHELQIGNAEQLRVYQRLHVQDMVQAEKSLHILFAPWHIRGEWFYLHEEARPLFNKIFLKQSTLNARELALLESLGLRTIDL